jgi:hypothetical protein
MNLVTTIKMNDISKVISWVGISISISITTVLSRAGGWLALIATGKRFR